MRAATKRCKLVSSHVALNAPVPENQLKHNDIFEFISECYFLKILVHKSSVGAPWISVLQGSESFIDTEPGENWRAINFIKILSIVHT